MIVDFRKFTDKEWLFNPVPPAQFYFFWLLFAFFASLIILAILFYFYFTFIKKQSLYQKIKNRFLNLFLICGIVGIILLGFRNQNIPYFSSNLLMLLIILIFIVWLLVNLLFLFISFRKEIKDFKRKKEIERYLPKKKNV